jgi:hypothetical protein
VAVAPRGFENALGLAGSAIRGRVEDREVLTDDLFRRVTLGARGAGVPGRDVSNGVEQVDRVVDDRIHQVVKARLPLEDLDRSRSSGCEGACQQAASPCRDAPRIERSRLDLITMAIAKST